MTHWKGCEIIGIFQKSMLPDQYDLINSGHIYFPKFTANAASWRSMARQALLIYSLQGKEVLDPKEFTIFSLPAWYQTFLFCTWYTWANHSDNYAHWALFYEHTFPMQVCTWPVIARMIVTVLHTPIFMNVMLPMMVSHSLAGTDCDVPHTTQSYEHSTNAPHVIHAIEVVTTFCTKFLPLKPKFK